MEKVSISEIAFWKQIIDFGFVMDFDLAMDNKNKTEILYFEYLAPLGILVFDLDYTGENS